MAREDYEVVIGLEVHAELFTKTKIYFKKSYLLLFIIPILTLIMVWTNNYNHLFYF